MTQVEISESLLVNRSNITGLVDRLEKNGYVSRVHDLKDRRINRIKIREKAKKIIRSLQEPYLKAIAETCRSLNKDELRTLDFLLEKIKNNLLKDIKANKDNK